MSTHDPVSELTAQLDALPTRDLAAIQAWLGRTLVERFFTQHGQTPAIATALATFDGDREAVYAWMTTPHAFLPGPAPIEQTQTPEGLEEVLRALLRIEHGVFG